MPVSRVLLLISTAAGVLSVAGALFSDARLSAQGGLAMLVTLIGYVIVAGRDAPPRTRWSLTAGIGMLAVGMALRLYWYHEPPKDFGWFSYGPLADGGLSQGLPEMSPGRLRGLWRQPVDRMQTAAFLHLLAVLCFAAGLVALPVLRRPGRSALTTVVAVGLLAFVASQFDGPAVLHGLGTVWPALLAVLAAAGLVVLAGRRADRAWLVAAGTLLVAVAAATVFDDLCNAWSVWWRFAQPAENAATVHISVALTATTDDSPEVTDALQTAGELAGPALLAIGALHAPRYVMGSGRDVP